MIVYHGRFLEGSLKVLGLQTYAKEFGHVLKSALLVCRAVGAIHIMNGQEQAKGGSLQVSDGRCVGLDDHWTSDFDGASGNRFSIDFNETQSARGIRMLHALKIGQRFGT